MMGDDEAGVPAGTGHADEGTIHAWLDGALAPPDAARVDAHVASCATCADATAEARGLIAASSRILGALDGEVGAATAGRRPAIPQRRRSAWPVGLRAAAALVVVASSALLLLQRTRREESARSAAAAAPRLKYGEAAPAAAPIPSPSASPIVSAAVPASEDRVAAQAAAPAAATVTASAARSGGCYAVIAPTPAGGGGPPLPRRFVLDTTPVGVDVPGAGARYAVRLDPSPAVGGATAAQSRQAVAAAGTHDASPAPYWGYLSRDSVRVVLPDLVTLRARVSAAGLAGTVAASDAPSSAAATPSTFAARRCEPGDSAR